MCMPQYATTGAWLQIARSRSYLCTFGTLAVGLLSVSTQPLPHARSLPGFPAANASKYLENPLRIPGSQPLSAQLQRPNTSESLECPGTQLMTICGVPKPRKSLQNHLRIPAVPNESPENTWRDSENPECASSENSHTKILRIFGVPNPRESPETP